MEPEPADVRRVVTMILESSGGEETVDWWLLIMVPSSGRQHAACIYMLTGRRERESRETGPVISISCLAALLLPGQPSSNGRGR